MEIVDIPTNKGRDKINSISECHNRIIMHYEKSGRSVDIEVPRVYVDYIKHLIDEMEYGLNYHSKYIYNKCVEKFGIESKVINKRLNLIKQILLKRNIEKQIVESIMNELNDSKEFKRMDFEELIGIRDTKESFYFKIYASIKYWEAKEKISYNKRGYIMRIE